MAHCKFVRRSIIGQSLSTVSRRAPLPDIELTERDDCKATRQEPARARAAREHEVSDGKRPARRRRVGGASEPLSPKEYDILSWNTMALNIKHPDADRLARELAQRTGESLTEAVLNALRERLHREEARRKGTVLRRELARIRERCAKLPVLDQRTAEDIIGYDERGLPR